MTFEDVGLTQNSSDRVVWKFAQTNGIFLLTASRNAKGEDLLEQIMREENQPTSFAIVTIGDPDRVNEFDYRERCVEKLVKIAIAETEIEPNVSSLFLCFATASTQKFIGSSE